MQYKVCTESIISVICVQILTNNYPTVTKIKQATKHERMTITRKQKEQNAAAAVIILIIISKHWHIFS